MLQHCSPSALPCAVPTAVSGCPWGAWIYKNGVAQLFEVMGKYSPISWIQIFKTSQFWMNPKLDFRGVTKRLQGALTDLDDSLGGHWPPASSWWKSCNLMFFALHCSIFLLFIKLLLKQNILSIWILKFIAGFFSIHHSHPVKLLSSSTAIETYKTSLIPKRWWVQKSEGYCLFWL